MYKAAVHTLVDGGIQGLSLTHKKTARIIKGDIIPQQIDTQSM